MIDLQLFMSVLSPTACRVDVDRERMSGHFSLLDVLSQFHHQSHELVNIERVVGELCVMRSHGGMLTLRE